MINLSKIPKVTAFEGGGGVSLPEIMTPLQFLEREIAAWKLSPVRQEQITGELYYRGEHDILKRVRTAIGAGGELEQVENLPNSRVVDNLYGKLVNQKANYLLGKPFVIRGKNSESTARLKEIFGRDFMRTLKNAGKSALNGGIAWLYACCGDNGKLCFRLLPSYEVLPFWKDNEHRELEALVRVYNVSGYEGKRAVTAEKAEVYHKDGVHRFILKEGRLIPDTNGGSNYFPYLLLNTANGTEAACRAGAACQAKAARWRGMPFAAVRCNEAEIPLISRVKTLQDGLNLMLSDYGNAMQEDARNTILVLRNYDGEDLGEFRRNLAAYGAVKVRCDSEGGGGVEALKIAVSAENYKTVIELLKTAIIENGMGYSGNEGIFTSHYSSPNQLSIKSMYTDMDLDANEMETELQAAFEKLLELAGEYCGKNFEGAEVIFNRDMLINETEAVDNCIKSLEVLSEETVIAQHPWVVDAEKEVEKKKRG